MKIENVRVLIGPSLVSMFQNEETEITNSFRILFGVMKMEFDVEIENLDIIDFPSIDPPNTYVLLINDEPAVKGEIEVGKKLAIKTHISKTDLGENPFYEPIEQAKCFWITSEQEEEAVKDNYMIIDASSLIVGHLDSAIRNYLKNKNNK